MCSKFILRKPRIYGIKFMCLTDSRNNYLINVYIYVGKKSDGNDLIVKKKV